MAPLAVVEDLYVLSYGGFSLCPSRVAAVVYQLIFEASPEALYRRVVIAVSPARHRCLHSKLINKFAVFVSTVLAATVRVVDQSGRRPFLLNRPE